MLHVAERRKHYIKGAKRELTPEWKTLVKDALTTRGQNQQWLEQQIGAGAGSVSRMLGETANISGLVDDICKVLKIPPPKVSSPTETRLLDLFRKLDDRQKAAFVEFLETTSAK